MLSVEEIKKACEFADGFDVDMYSHREVLNFPDGQWTFLDYTSELFQLITYPLFLQRVIEGMNKHTDYYIVNDKDKMLCGYGIKNIPLFYLAYKDFDSIDQAKEQAIKYILENS